MVELKYTCYNVLIILKYSSERIIRGIISLLRREAAPTLLNISKVLKTNALPNYYGIFIEGVGSVYNMY